MKGVKVILQGGGEHARVVLDSLLASGMNVLGLFDPKYSDELFGVKQLGQYNASFEPEARAVVAIGDNALRKKVAENTKHSFVEVIDVTAIISPFASVGMGTMVLQGAIIQARASIGKHVIINTGARVDHDCSIDNYVHIAPGAVLCGTVHVGEGAFIGAGATILPGKKIGKWATIGAGAVVVSDIPDHAVAVGNPARIRRVHNAKPKPIYIYGAGGLGREIKALLTQLPDWSLAGFYDDTVKKGEDIEGISCRGPLSELLAVREETNIVMGVGDPIVKERLVASLKKNRAINFPTLIHPTAVILDSKTVTIGEGSVIGAGAILTTRISIGHHVLVNINATIGHDCFVDDYSSIMPGVNLAGNVSISECVLVGSGASILNGMAIGKRSRVGAGAVVTKEVKEGQTVVGIPAKEITA